MKTTTQPRMLWDHFLVCTSQIQRWTSNTKTNGKKILNNLFRFLYLSHLVFIFNFFLFILKWAIVTVSKVGFFYFIRFVPNNTVANFLMYSSGAPRLANPISCENWANAGSAKRGTWPNNSWQTSLKMKAKKVSINRC